MRRLGHLYQFCWAKLQSNRVRAALALVVIALAVVLPYQACSVGGEAFVLRNDHASNGPVTLNSPLIVSEQNVKAFQLNGRCDVPIKQLTTIRVTSTTNTSLIYVDAAGVPCTDGAFNTTLDMSRVPDGPFRILLSTDIGQFIELTGEKDTVGPASSISAPSVTNATYLTPILVTVIFEGASEITLGPADVVFSGTAVSGCTPSISGSGLQQRIVAITGCNGNGTVKVRVAAGAAKDSFGNLSFASAESNAVTVSNAGPAVNISAPSPVSGGKSTVFQWTVSFQNTTTITLTEANITLSGATAGCTMGLSGSGATRTVSVTNCTGDGSVTITLAAGTAANGNYLAPAVGPSLPVIVDNQTPTAVLTGQPSSPSNTKVLYITVDGTDVVTYKYKIGNTDTIDCTNGTGYSSAISKTVAITNNISTLADNWVRLCVVAGDASGNFQPYSTATTATWLKDTTAPTIAISAPTPASGTSATTFQWLVSYSGENSITLDATNISLGGTATAGCQKSVSGTGSNQTVTVSGCTANGSLTISIAASTAADSAGNFAPAAGPSASVTVSNQAPTAVVSGQPTGTSNVKVLNVTVSGTDVTTYKYKVGNTDTIDCTSSTGYSADIPKATLITNNISTLADNWVRLCVVAGDSFGNYQAFSSATTATWMKDTTAPTISIGSPTPTSGTSATSFQWIVTYTGESTITLASTHITLSGTATTGCGKSVGGSGSTRTITVTGCTGTGSLAISIAAGTATDAAGNSAPAAGPSTAVSVTAAQTASPAGTSIPPATEIFDSSLSKWTIVNGLVYKNGSMAAITRNVIRLYWDGTSIFQQNSDLYWWRWNGSGWGAPVSNPLPNTSVASVTSGTTWVNAPFAPQTVRTQLSFDAIPTGPNLDGVIGFSNGAATDYPNLALIVRFNDMGTIDARKGTTYFADTNLAYVVGTTYHFRIVANFATHTYDVYVAPASGAEVLVALGYPFRAEQATITQLSNLGTITQFGTVLIMNVSVSSPP